MAKILSQNYSYANNSSGELINVANAQRSEKYFCPICGDEMTPHMGKVRRWHFVHKNGCNCSYESYLHELAKIKIRQAFLSSDHFMLSYNAKALCSLECPFIDSPRCNADKPVEFDLRKFYDSCEIEAPYHKYRADLLLSSSAKPKTDPVLIEIMVTHKCTQDKINDGVRIIEIPIQSEQQIDDIVKSCKLSAKRNSSYVNDGDIILYNFNKIESVDPSEIIIEQEDYFSRKNTLVFWLNKQGHFHSTSYRCFEISKKLPSNVHYYISTRALSTSFKDILQGFSRRGVKIRNCFLCKFSKQDYNGDRICILYKKHNLPRKPSPYYATSCPHYKEDFVTDQSMIQYDENELKSQEIKFYYHICKEIL